MKKMGIRSKWNATPVLRYLIVGAWNTLFGVILLYLLFFLFKTKYYEYELGATYVLGTAQSYGTQRWVVWKSSTSPKNEFSRFAVASISQYMLNAIMLYFSVHGLNLKPNFTALPIMLMIASAFYFVNRNLVFRTTNV
jgi:putative flippase GtrA